VCDYSLHNVHNRLAVEGEPLQIHQFQSGSLGLASPSDLKIQCTAQGRSRSSWLQKIKDCFSADATDNIPAVCVPPGARLVMREISPLLQKKHNIGAEEEVTFVQLNSLVNSYRDGIRFHNGEMILLQQLPVRQQFDVLNLAGSTEQELPVLQQVERIRVASGAAF